MGRKCPRFVILNAVKNLPEHGLRSFAALG
jgi:hypothetical protein